MLLVFAFSLSGGGSHSPGYPDLPGSDIWRSTPESQGPILFFVLWVGVVIYIIYSHLRNALSHDAPPMSVIEYDVQTPPPYSTLHPPPETARMAQNLTVRGPTAQRLREVEMLKNMWGLQTRVTL